MSNHRNTSKELLYAEVWCIFLIFTSFLPSLVSCLRLWSVSYIASAGSHGWQLKQSSVSQEAHSKPMWPAQHPRLNSNPVDSCSARICVLGGWRVFYLACAKPKAALEKYSNGCNSRRLHIVGNISELWSEIGDRKTHFQNKATIHAYIFHKSKKISSSSVGFQLA